MIHKAKTKVTHELLAHSPINDEFLFRELAHKLVKDMPLEELKKLIFFTKTDANTPESVSKINNYLTPHDEKHLLIRLRDEQVLLYEAQINL